MKRHKLMVTSQVPGFNAKEFFLAHWAVKRNRRARYGGPARRPVISRYVRPTIRYDPLDSGSFWAQTWNRIKATATALIKALRLNRKG